MTDDDLGHASSVAEQLRLAKENDTLPEELEEKHDLDEEDDDQDDDSDKLDRGVDR